MVRSKRSASGREARKAKKEEHKKLVELGLNSPTRQCLKPRKISTSERNVVEEDYRKLVDYLVKSAMSKFELIEYEPPADLALKDFPFQEFEKVFKITFIQTDLWFGHWKEFFRKHYCNMMESRDSYLEHIFVGLNCIYDRDSRPFLENLLAVHSFVLCATVYFTYNGWPQALLHPVRVLASQFESQLRLTFFEVGGFKGLAKFCKDHEYLKMYDYYYCEERKITPEIETLDKDVKARVRKDVHDIMQEYDEMLLKYDKEQLSIQKALAWVRFDDLEVRSKRIIGNEWRFKDAPLGMTILADLDARERRIKERLRWTALRIGKPQPATRLETIPEEPELRVPSLVEERIIKDLKSVLESFDTSIFELEKRAESLME